jgi:histidinol-phosphate aminotransferase
VPYMLGRVNEVLQARAWTLDALAAAGIDYHPAAANFILIKTQDAARAVEDFRACGVLVRDRSYLPQLEGYIRVTIGTMEEMRRFVAIAKEVLSG